MCHRTLYIRRFHIRSYIFLCMFSNSFVIWKRIWFFSCLKEFIIYKYILWNHILIMWPSAYKHTQIECVCVCVSVYFCVCCCHGDGASPTSTTTWVNNGSVRIFFVVWISIEFYTSADLLLSILWCCGEHTEKFRGSRVKTTDFSSELWISAK